MAFEPFSWADDGAVVFHDLKMPWASVTACLCLKHCNACSQSTTLGARLMLPRTEMRKLWKRTSVAVACSTTWTKMREAPRSSIGKCSFTCCSSCPSSMQMLSRACKTLILAWPFTKPTDQACSSPSGSCTTTSGAVSSCTKRTQGGGSVGTPASFSTIRGSDWLKKPSARKPSARAVASDSPAGAFSEAWGSKEKCRTCRGSGAMLPMRSAVVVGRVADVCTNSSRGKGQRS